MIIDHIGAIFFPNITILRLIGRISFPLYCFLLVDGYFHVKNDKNRLLNYVMNLLIFAIISELPYNLLFHNRISYFFSQNVFFDLLLGLLMMILCDYADNHNNKALKFFSIYFFIMLSLILFTNYSVFGILLIFGLYLYKKHAKIHILIISILLFIALQLAWTIINYYITPDGSLIENIAKNYTLIGVLFAILPILSYNGSQGKNNKIIKYLFYFSYPAHIIIMLLIKNLI